MPTQPRLRMFTKCCCCIPLRAGCFVLGYLNLIFNAFHTLGLLALTTYIGITTHGFDHYDPEGPRMSPSMTPDVQSVEKPFLNQVGLLLMMILFVNVVWLVVSVACLAGLHKKRPGPVRVYVAFASGRLLLAAAGFIYLAMSSTTDIQVVLSHCIDIALTAYFIVVYYVYAVQLDRESVENQDNIEKDIGDISYIYYPLEVDKKNVVISDSKPPGYSKSVQ
ncbi:hypothetical protein ACJJTC_010903 [Scirpophaga incertulas]